MRTTSLFLALVTSFFMVSCTGDSLPTAATESSDSADGLAKAAQGDRSEWELMLFGTFAEGDFAIGNVSCLSGGEGEDAWFVGSYAWYYKRTLTPSGNVNDNIRGGIFDDTGLVGITTGDYWKQVAWNSQFPMHMRHTDGLIYLRQEDNGWFVNEATGERVRIMWHWNQVLDQDWNLLSDDSRLVSCTRVGGR